MQNNNTKIICQLATIMRVHVCVSDKKDRLATKYAPSAQHSCRCLASTPVADSREDPCNEGAQHFSRYLLPQGVDVFKFSIATVNRKVYVLTRQLCIHTYVRTIYVGRYI